jgi:hypothetical protein
MESTHLSLDAAKAFKILRSDLRIDSNGVISMRTLHCVFGFIVFDFMMFVRVRILHVSLILLRRRLLVTTLTELKAMAALARMGLRRIPATG